MIGLEVAAAAVELPAASCTSSKWRLMPWPVACLWRFQDVLVSEHRRRGVDLRFGVGVTALEGTGTVSAVRLQGGDVIACDVVVYGVGVRPRTELAEAAGLAVDNGIVANRFLQTKEDPDIFACGDVCRYESRIFGSSLRLENWRDAEDQADTAARNMLGQEKAFDEVPWFWSNQYDCALQVAGLPTHGEITVATTSGAARLFLSLTADGTLRGASALGPVRDVASPIRKLKAAIALAPTIDIGTNGCPPGAIDALLEN